MNESKKIISRFDDLDPSIHLLHCDPRKKNYCYRLVSIGLTSYAEFDWSLGVGAPTAPCMVNPFRALSCLPTYDCVMSL